MPYSARFSARKTLSISVLPDGAVEVIAPIGTGKDAIEECLKKRGRWILCQQRFFEQFNPRTPPRAYVGGETHLYLGRQYRLKITQGVPEGVKLKNGYFCIDTKDPQEPDSVVSLLKGWYRQKAEAKFRERYLVMILRLGRFIPEFPPPLSIRVMKRRWGSLSKAGRLILNVDLIRAPTACIDYVLVHELAHAVHPNHGKAFYALLDAVMPDWPKRKQRLEILLS